MAEIAFADSRDGSTLGAYLERLLALDRTAAVRMVGVGAVAAGYGAPPLSGAATRRGGVLSVRTVALAEGTAPFDRTVSAGRLLEALTADRTGFTLPEPLLSGPSWAGLLPPRRGWTGLGEIPVRDLAHTVAQGAADFRFQALGRDRAGLDALAEEIWSRRFPSGLGWRCAHAASALGFLGADPAASDATARLAGHTRWLRLDAPFGTVVERLAAVPVPAAQG